MFHKSYQSVKAAKVHVNQHSPVCKAAALGLWVETRRLDAMAGGSGAAWQAQDVLHQPPGIFVISQLSAVKKCRNRYIPGSARDVLGYVVYIQHIDP